MTVDPEELLELRVPCPADLADFIKTMREMNKWSQATLAEIARVTERTIQRVAWPRWRRMATRCSWSIRATW
jgi:ribosome-binding protein aMBF1 (putative translation factor)